MNKRIYLSPPHLTEEAMTYLRDAIESNWIAPVGPYVDAFEKELADLLKTGAVLSVNSGTSAIHLALLAMGVGKDDEVICSTFTFCASANPIIYCGARPVFVDSEEDSWNMDPDLLEEAITDRIKKCRKKPRAIVVVHLYGMPARMDQIVEIAKRHEIPVLEDAAEALGSSFNGKALGTFGDAGVLSFNGNKIITASSGGALVSANEKLIEKARYLRQEAKEPLAYYEHKEIGYNYRFSNVLAALGSSQLKALDERVRLRRKIFKYYQDQLKGISGIGFQPEGAGSLSNRWLTAMLIRHDDVMAEHIRMELEIVNIESRPLWKPMHLQPVFKDCPSYVNGLSEALFDSGLCLPSGSDLTNGDLERVVQVIMGVLKR